VIIIPIMDHSGEQVGLVVSGHAREGIASDDLAAVSHSRPLQQRGGSRNDMRQVEQHTMQGWISLQKGQSKRDPPPNTKLYSQANRTSHNDKELGSITPPSSLPSR
jgi:hypothetical protein